MYTPDESATDTYLSRNGYFTKKNDINEVIIRCTGKINFIEQQSISISGHTADYNSITVQTSNLSRPPEQFTIKIELLKKERQDKYDELEALNNLFRRSIDLLPSSKERMILELRDVDNQGWPEIEAQLDCTYEYARKLHKRAVKHLEQRLACQKDL